MSALATGASVVLYDGSPLVPSPNVLWDLTDRLGYVNNVKQKDNHLCCCYVTTYKDSHLMKGVIPMVANQCVA